MFCVFPSNSLLLSYFSFFYTIHSIEDQKSNKKVHTEKGSTDSSSNSNCITEVASKKSVISKSLLNTFLLSFISCMQECPLSSLSILQEIIDCFLSILFNQCSVLFFFLFLIHSYILLLLLPL